VVGIAYTQEGQQWQHKLKYHISSLKDMAADSQKMLKMAMQKIVWRVGCNLQELGTAS